MRRAPVHPCDLMQKVHDMTLRGFGEGVHRQRLLGVHSHDSCVAIKSKVLKATAKEEAPVDQNAPTTTCIQSRAHVISSGACEHALASNRTNSYQPRIWRRVGPEMQQLNLRATKTLTLGHTLAESSPASTLVCAQTNKSADTANMSEGAI